MSSLRDTAAAIAARFTGVTATLDGVTESFVVVPTSLLPNGIAKGPALLVFHPEGVLDVGVSRIRSDTHDFPVRFLRDPIDLPSRSDWLYVWYDALRDRVEMDMDLGLAYVAWARPVSSRVEVGELGGFAYGAVTFDLIELIVRVRFDEVVPTVAI